MNVTEANVNEDNGRIIPLKEITKDWLLISISIIIIGKSENQILNFVERYPTLISKVKTHGQ